ncbi:site-specific integrase, partial [Treponema vincentii]
IAAEYTEWVKNIATIAPTNDRQPLTTEIAALVQAACQNAVNQALQNIPYSKQALPLPFVPDYEDVPETIKPLLDHLPTLAFYDYLLLYWNYDESPDIKERISKGETPPNPERFRQSTGILKKYAANIPSCPLAEITGLKIDAMLGAIRNAGKLKEQTMKNISYIFIQPLHFAYRNNLLARDVAQQITPVSKNTRKKAKKEAEKAI